MDSGSGVAMICGVGCRHGSDLALVWPLTWKHPYATGAALKRQKQTKNQKTLWSNVILCII